MSGNINTEKITYLQLIIKNETLEDLHIKTLMATTKLMLLGVLHGIYQIIQQKSVL
jgi:hypothetical protein